MPCIIAEINGYWDWDIPAEKQNFKDARQLLDYGDL
jgi:hypothetical protein